MGLRVIPITLKEANAFVTKFHRHHKKVPGCRFCLGAERGQELVGVAIVGRPVGRHVNQYAVCEVSRLCTNGGKNVCSFLYGACARVAREMGFAAIQTYILEEELGTTLKAVGWKREHIVINQGIGWGNRPGRQSSLVGLNKIRYRKLFVKNGRVPLLNRRKQ